MATLTILRGVSGSGKSTWAAQQNAVVVSRDSLRVALFGSDGPDYYEATDVRDREDTITLFQNAAIESALKAGRDVIVDNTNIEWRYVKEIAKIGHRVGAKVETKVFDVPLQRAINNNIFRHARGGRDVPRRVIERQHSRLQGTKDKVLEPVFVPAPYEGTPGKPKAFLVDIDGTLAHMKDRSPFDWKRVSEDDVDEVIADIVYRLRFGSLGNEDYDMTCIVMSGRDESCRDETQKWLNEHNIWGDHLFMRPEKDMRPDNIIKSELFDKHVRDNFDVRFVLDDRQQVVDMWRAMGITCLQVAPGDF